MIVKTLHGIHSLVESIEGNMIINSCDVIVEENLFSQLEDIKMIGCVIKSPNKIIRTDEKGDIYKVTDIDAEKEIERLKRAFEKVNEENKKYRKLLNDFKEVLEIE